MFKNLANLVWLQERSAIVAQTKKALEITIPVKEKIDLRRLSVRHRDGQLEITIPSLSEKSKCLEFTNRPCPWSDHQ